MKSVILLLPRPLLLTVVAPPTIRLGEYTDEMIKQDLMNLVERNQKIRMTSSEVSIKGRGLFNINHCVWAVKITWFIHTIRMNKLIIFIVFTRMMNQWNCLHY